MVDGTYTYLAWNLVFLAVWLFIYLVRPKVRREMLLFSIMCIPLGPIAAYFYFGDYFQPARVFGGPFGIEDLLNAFVNAGIAGALYEFVRFDGRGKPERPGLVVYALAAYAFGTLFMYSGVALGFSSINTSLVMFALVGLSMVVARPRLLRNALWSGLLFCGLHTVFYICFFAVYPEALSWWRLENASGILPLGIPLEEYAWTFGWGFVAGPASELVARLKVPRFAGAKLREIGGGT